MQINKKVALALAVALIVIGTMPEARAQTRFVGPSISSVTPAAPARSATAQVLTITGINFSAGLSLNVVAPDGQKLNYSGAAIQARRETSFQVGVVLAAAGAYSLTVMNADGAVSDPFVLKSQASPTPAVTPRIDHVLPEALTKDSQPQTLTVTGDRFVSGLSVSVTDPIGGVYLVKGSAVGAVTTTSIEITVALEMTGDYTVMVTNPSGQSSNSLTIKVVMRRR